MCQSVLLKDDYHLAICNMPLSINFQLKEEWFESRVVSARSKYLFEKLVGNCAIFNFFNLTSITFSSRQIEPFSLLHHNPCESIIYINVLLPARHTFVITSMWMHFRRGKIIKEGLTTSGNLNVLQRVIIVISKYETQFVHRQNIMISLYCPSNFELK